MIREFNGQQFAVIRDLNREVFEDLRNLDLMNGISVMSTSCLKPSKQPRFGPHKL